jgi:hypothetical protein
MAASLTLLQITNVDPDASSKPGSSSNAWASISTFHEPGLERASSRCSCTSATDVGGWPE